MMRELSELSGRTETSVASRNAGVGAVPGLHRGGVPVLREAERFAWQNLGVTLTLSGCGVPGVGHHATRGFLPARPLRRFG